MKYGCKLLPNTHRRRPIIVGGGGDSTRLAYIIEDPSAQTENDMAYILCDLMGETSQPTGDPADQGVKVFCRIFGFGSLALASAEPRPEIYGYIPVRQVYFPPPAAWAADFGTYGVGDYVTFGEKYYRCLALHDSSTGNSPLAASKWAEVDLLHWECTDIFSATSNWPQDPE